MNPVFGFFSGLIFGIGLILSGMTEPLKVKGFLDLAGSWDPSLGFVMAGAIALAALAFARARGRERSWTGTLIEIPDDRTIDRRLIAGGVLFGAGWGIAGFCPGPALVALGSGMGSAGIFVAAMLVGMVVHDKLEKPGRES
ncbi:MAG: DUF6691 family protein [Burkholderiales bacterium]